ncbi:hypothetical protein LPN01_15670 [Sphingomonas sp. A2-49]|uniref:hypothetical protein n=1 Tax=Sphingomonas sp. A2-49 TaxID=1391375 RepID=UPI0021D37029|nr:hypothetical protein [Sphingomonas sp. A2-49]MCU6455518.1 hypothetical protein [Sphingomonas sp. A2-49]
MRRIMAGCGLAALALAGCSKAPDSTGTMEAPAATGDTVPAAPGIAVTAAPGVAFNYRYGFRLPPRAIAAAQEAHAAACEKLGIARCRITGMDYRVMGENAIRGTLAFKLDPAIARAFGKQGVDLIQAARGTLVSATITGTDAGAAIERAAATRDDAAAAARRAEAQLARPGAGAAERAELQRQRAAAATAARDAAGVVADNRASLATTPVQFDYDSGDAIRGFDSSAPLTSALDTMVGSAQVTLAVLLGAIAIFGPPGLALAIVVLLWRRVRGPLRRRVARGD